MGSVIFFLGSASILKTEIRKSHMKLVLKFADGAAHAVHVYLPHLAEFWGGGDG